MKNKCCRNLAILLIGLFFSLETYSQEYSNLGVGDQVPDYTFTNLINYPTNTAKVSDFKGKLLILDFWSTSCVSCIASWPKLIKLQENFKNKIQIILVNPTQNEERVRSVFAKRKKLAGVDVTLPTICGDTILSKQMFQHSSVPHVVWIDVNGVVRSISFGQTLNETNIKAFLSGKHSEIPQKTDYEIQWNQKKPLFVNGNAGNGNKLVWNATFSNYVDGLGRTFGFNIAKDSSSLYAINCSPLEMYAIAYSSNLEQYERIPLSRIRLNVRDTSAYQLPEPGKSNNMYTYHLFTNGQQLSILKDAMQTDINRQFRTNVEWKMVKKQCLVFSIEDAIKARYREGKKRLIISDVEFRVNGMRMEQIISFLETDLYFFSKYPIIDETAQLGELCEINIETNVKDPIALDNQLGRYGIRLKIEPRIVKVLTINED